MATLGLRAQGRILSGKHRGLTQQVARRRHGHTCFLPAQVRLGKAGAPTASHLRVWESGILWSCEPPLSPPHQAEPPVANHQGQQTAPRGTRPFKEHFHLKSRQPFMFAKDSVIAVFTFHLTERPVPEPRHRATHTEPWAQGFAHAFITKRNRQAASLCHGRGTRAQGLNPGR